MNNELKINNFLSVIISNGAYSSVDNLKFKLDELFKGIDFKGKNVLEVGGGNGMFCFYSSINGAKTAINLEPVGDGSTSDIVSKFNNLRESLGINNVELIPLTFQDYKQTDIKFDIILLYNSINHLDEKACIDLKVNPNSQATYKELFLKLRDLANPNAEIIICDCSNENFYPLIGLKNPFDPNIEWHKHQSPNVWKKLLMETGFTNPRISWTTFNRLRNFGKLFFANKLASYFLTSHFCLRMKRKP